MGKNKMVYPQTKMVTKIEKIQIIDECVNGKISPSGLSKKYQVNPDTIRTWVRKAGMKLPNPNEYKDFKNNTGNQNKIEETDREVSRRSNETSQTPFTDSTLALNNEKGKLIILLQQRPLSDQCQTV